MSNFTTENLIPYTGTIQPGQRLIKRKDGTFLPVGVAGAASSEGGGSSAAENISSGVVILDGTVNVESGWEYQDTWMVNGGGGSMTISSGGTATDTIVHGDCYVHVSSGATATDTINRDGSMYVSDGGKAINTVMLGGSMYVSSGGTATDTVVLGGRITISSGGTLINTRVAATNAVVRGTADAVQIDNGGYMSAASAGTVNNVLIQEGGRLDVYNYATASSVTVFGILDVDGSADYVHVKSGGLMYARDGSTITNLVVD